MPGELIKRSGCRPWEISHRTSLPGDFVSEEVQMDSKNSYEGINEYAVKLVKFRASKLVGDVGFTEADREDLEQEMILDFLLRLPKFDPRRAKKSTFIAQLVEHSVIGIVGKQKAAMRDYRLRAGSLNECREDEDGHQTERIQTLGEDEYFRRINGQARSRQELEELTIDLKSAIAELPAELRTLCQRLRKETLSGISRGTGVPRTTLYDLLKKLAVMLEETKIKDYL